MGNLNSSSLNGFLMGWGFWGLIVFMSGAPSTTHADGICAVRQAVKIK
jgi:hypothetical protein